MKKYMDKYKKKLKINNNLFVFLLVLVIIGIITGAIFSSILDIGDKKMILKYLNDFFVNIKNDNISYNDSLLNTLLFTVGFAILIWILGLSVIGFFLVIFLLFLKSFILGFTVGSLVLNFKIKGIIIAFIYCFPHQVINLLIFMLICSYALIVSFKIIRCFNGKKDLDFKTIINKYLIVILFSIIILIITSLYENYLMPYFLKILFALLK